MNSRDFELRENYLRVDVECEAQSSQGCVKLIHPAEPAWFRGSAPSGEALIMCQPCMKMLIQFENEMRAKKLPRRRWRVHYQFPGQATLTRSFEYREAANAEMVSIHGHGGRAMVEDRWNQT